MLIESRNNKLIREILKLREKNYRDKSNQFIIEGKKFVDEIPTSWQINKIVVAQSFALAKNYANVFVLPDKLFAQIADTKHSQGILAICAKKNFFLDDFTLKENSLFVIAEKINDPGNLGTLIRSCAAFNVDGLIISKGSVDLYNPKVLRATAGNIFKLNIATDCDLEIYLPKLKRNDVKIFAASGNAEKFCFDANFKSKCAIIVGNEANGISENVLSQADEIIKIPMENKVESLNISTATSILLYEAWRQKYFM